MQEHINNLTDTVNTVLKISSKKQIDTCQLYETLLGRKRILIFEIEILMSAKTFLFNSRDKKTFANKHSINITMTDVMEVSNIKVFLDNNFLHFLITYATPKSVRN